MPGEPCATANRVVRKKNALKLCHRFNITQSLALHAFPARNMLRPMTQRPITSERDPEDQALAEPCVQGD
jgi:hypothetical protein